MPVEVVRCHNVQGPEDQVKSFSFFSQDEKEAMKKFERGSCIIKFAFGKQGEKSSLPIVREKSGARINSRRYMKKLL